MQRMKCSASAGRYGADSLIHSLTHSHTPPLTPSASCHVHLCSVFIYPAGRMHWRTDQSPLRVVSVLLRQCLARVAESLKTHSVSLRAPHLTWNMSVFYRIFQTSVILLRAWLSFTCSFSYNNMASFFSLLPEQGIKHFTEWRSRKESNMRCNEEITVIILKIVSSAARVSFFFIPLKQLTNSKKNNKLWFFCPIKVMF